MIIQCINCNKKFNVNSDLIPSTGRNIQCGSCNHVWFFNNDQIDRKINNDQIDRKINNDQINKEIDFDKIKKQEIKNDNQILAKEAISTKKTKSKKNLEIVKFEKKSDLTISKLFSYLIVLIISLVSLIIVVDTFKSPLINLFPNLELIIFNFYEVIKDINLFIIDLFKYD